MTAAPAPADHPAATDPAAVPTRFFHGTRARLAVGDVLLPGEWIGRYNYAAGWNDDLVWMTTVLAEAWMWAEAARGDDSPVVYEVVPLGEPTDWASENGWTGADKQFDEWVVATARIVAVAPAAPYATLSTQVC